MQKKARVVCSIMFISASQGLEIMCFYFSCFFHFCSFLFFLPLAFSCVFPLLRKWSLVLGNCHQGLFLEPFSFLLILFRFCIVLDFFFLPLPWKLSLEIIKRSFFSNPFLIFSFLHRFGYVSFLCLQNWPWKLSEEAFSRTLLFFFRFGYFSSFAFKSDLGNCQKELFLEPFLYFFRFGYVFSFAFKIHLGNCQKELFLEPFSGGNSQGPRTIFGAKERHMKMPKGGKTGMNKNEKNMKNKNTWFPVPGWLRWT